MILQAGSSSTVGVEIDAFLLSRTFILLFILTHDSFITDVESD